VRSCVLMGRPRTASTICGKWLARSWPLWLIRRTARPCLRCESRHA
jgi:hypothetical protein